MLDIQSPHDSIFTAYASPVFQPKNIPMLTERSGMPLQMSDSIGSVTGWPARYHTIIDKRRPGINMTPPIMRVLRRRMMCPTGGVA
tara:strand:- start:1662 stop:1919 length:258 start_codon:yes stop_codon:yes gene_type:complete